jgi:hypothetical protein
MPWDIVVDGEGNARQAAILAVHAALLPSAQVVLFGGSEHSFDRFSDFKGGIPLLKAQLFHLSSETLTNIAQSPNTDLFCCGHAFLGDGRLIAAGGTREWPISFYEGEAPENPHEEMAHWDGERACWIYNHWQGRWVRVRDLAFEPIAGDPDYQQGGGRWYPTLVTLANGSVIAFAGHPNHEHTVHEHINPEIYSAGKDAWEVHADRVLNFRYSVYPRGHLIPDGRIFFVSPNQDDDCGIYDPASGDFAAITGLPADKNDSISERDFNTVLLPLLPGDNYRAHVLAAGWSGEAIRVTVDDGAWMQAGSRAWDGATPPRRRNGCAVLLPTGQVALVGGVELTDVDGDMRELDSGAILRAEIYTPGIDWPSGDYGGFSSEQWETDSSDEAAAVPRNYHSVALLLPDGRILTAGSNFNAGTGHPDVQAEKRIEIYRPWYFDADDRPQITDSPASVTYDQVFTIETPDAARVERVAMLRLGSVTHGFDADQRYVGLTIVNRGSSTVTVESPPSGAIAPPGYYMLWIVDDDGLPCQAAPFVKLGHQGMFFVLDRSSISVHDVESKLETGPAVFSRAFYVVLDGVAPNDYVGVTLTLTLDTGVGDPASELGITAPPVEVLYDVGQAEGDTAQRITLVYSLRFQDDDVFSTFDELRQIHLRAESGAAETRAVITLHKQPNPYMSDGDSFWLSTDLRVFRVVEGEFGYPLPVYLPGTDPLFYLQTLLESYMAPHQGIHPFDLLSEDQEVCKLELARSISSGFFPLFDISKRVFNFAVARVRYRSLATEATDVRVFFRLFNTVGTALEFDTDKAYRRSGNGPMATPRIGRDGKEILSIPYFGSPRVDATDVSMDTQDDPINRKTLQPTGSEESETYFGCWLDFNQTEPRYPLYPTTDGPFDGELKSLQELTRGYHQCLVAEIHFGTDLIPLRATPTTSDKLAQRNLWIEEAPNPGATAQSRVVLATCEVQSTRQPLTPSASGALDELMIRWNNLPRSSRVTLFMPALDASEIVEASAQRRGGPALRQLDAHTVELLFGDVSYVPIPRIAARTIPGLLRIELPEGIKKGQLFWIQMHQFTDFGRPRNAPRELIASFQLDIPVRTSAEVLPRLIQRYSVMKHVAGTIPENDRWYPVYRAYVDETGERLRGLGQDPGAVAPSHDGTGSPWHPGPHEPPCAPDAGRGVTGRVCRILYDCAGEFEGFALDLCPGERRFHSREPGVHRLVREACERRWRITVIAQEHDPCALLRIETLC